VIGNEDFSSPCFCSRSELGIVESSLCRNRYDIKKTSEQPLTFVISQNISTRQANFIRGHLSHNSLHIKANAHTWGTKLPAKCMPHTITVTSAYSWAHKYFPLLCFVINGIQSNETINNRRNNLSMHGEDTNKKRKRQSPQSTRTHLSSGERHRKHWVLVVMISSWVTKTIHRQKVNKWKRIVKKTDKM
jgi:hypothetical protein